MQLPRTRGAMLRARTPSSLRIDRTCSRVSRSIPARSNASKAFRLARRLASNSPINAKADRAPSSVVGTRFAEGRPAAEMGSVGIPAFCIHTLVIRTLRQGCRFDVPVDPVPVDPGLPPAAPQQLLRQGDGAAVVFPSARRSLALHSRRL